MGKFTSADVEIKAKDQTAKGVKSAKKNVGGLTKAVKAYGAEMAAVYLAVRKAYRIVQDLTDAWGKQEIAVIEMNNALKNTGLFTPMLSGELQELAKHLQSTTTYGDELTLSAISMLQSLGELDDEMLKRAIPAVQDLATSLFKGDMLTASSMFAKVVGSSTNALSRYGIEIDMSGTKAEKFEEIMAKVNAKFGGRSAELADSYTGKMKQLSNAYGDLREAMGHVMANQMEPAIPLMMEITTQLTTWINKKLALKEAYEDIKQPMQDANDQVTIEIVQAKQLIAIDTLRILLADKQNAEYTVMGMNLKTMNEQRDREISRLQAIISGSARELKAIEDLIAARAEAARKEEEHKKKQKETKAVMDELIVSSDEWANTIVWTGEALDDYIAMLNSARESQEYLNEETETGIEDMTDYASAMLRVQENAALMESKQERVTLMIEEQNKALEEQEEAIKALENSFIAFANAVDPMANLLKEMAKTGFSIVLRAIGEVLMAEAAAATFAFQFGRAAAAFAGGLAAIMASNAIKSLAKGGDFVTNGPQLLLVGDNPSGREHVRVDPLGSDGGRAIIVNVYGSVQTEKDLAQTIAREIGRQGYSVT